jgi:hypothetical protein
MTRPTEMRFRCLLAASARSIRMRFMRTYVAALFPPRRLVREIPGARTVSTGFVTHADARRLWDGDHWARGPPRRCCVHRCKSPQR